MLLLLLPALVGADARDVIRYEYDDAGHTTELLELTEEGAPQVDTLAPNIAAIDTPIRVHVTGLRLLGVRIHTTQPGLHIDAVRTTQTDATFTLLATEATPIGPAPLQFTTSLGTTIASIRIRAPVPQLQVQPFPIALRPAERLQLSISLSNADAEAHTVQLSLSGTSTARLGSTQLSLPAGTRQGTVALLGLQAGLDQLTLSAPPRAPITLTVAVLEGGGALSAGTHTVHARPLGVSRGATEVSTTIPRGPLLARVGVQKGAVAVPGAITGVLPAPLLGVTRGPILLAVEPTHLTGGQTATLRVQGIGLQAVSSATLEPGLSASIQTQTAETLTLTVTVPVSALSHTVQLRLRTPTDPVIAVPGRDRLRVNPGSPRLYSLNPSRVVPGQLAQLTIRGLRLLDVERIEALPDTGIHLGDLFEEQLDGRILHLDLSVAETAPAGPRVIRVHTLSGDSGDIPLAVNTLHVINGPPLSYAPIASQPLGIHVATAAIPQTRTLYASLGVHIATAAIPQTHTAYTALGVARAPTALQISPPEAVLGTELTLVIEGSGLQTTDTLSLHPATGLSIGPLTTTEGRVSTTLQIAADAAPGPRRVQLGSATRPTVFADPAAAILQLATRAVPRILSLHPPRSTAGQSLELLLQGVHLTDAALRIVPDLGIRLGTPQITADGLDLRIQLNLAPDAAPGPRTLIITTPEGSSSAAPRAANTFTITPARQE